MTIHKLKRFYTGSDADFGHLVRCIHHLKPDEFPFCIRKKGSTSRGVTCRDRMELEIEADLFFDDHPYETMEVFRPRGTTRRSKRHRRKHQ
jgi:hypothetical protein